MASGHFRTVGTQAGHVVRVAAVRVARDLAVDVRAARLRGVELLEDEDRGALPHHEAVAVAVERAGGVLGVVVPPRGRLDRVEAGHRDRRDPRLGGAGDDDVRLSVLDQLVPVADAVDPRRAAGGHDDGRPVGAELERDLGRQRARHERVVEEGRRVLVVDEPLLAVVRDDDVVALQHHRPPHRAAQRHGQPLAVDSFEIEARVGDGLHRRGDGELDVPVHAVHFLVVQPRLVRVEIRLGRDLRAEALRIEERDLARRGLAGRDAVPERFPVDPSRRDDPYPGYDASSHGLRSSVSTCPASGRGASGPRWKTMNASSLPSFLSRCLTLTGI